MIVDLKKSAILNIIISSVEVYKKETYGILLGDKTRNRCNVIDSITFQSAKRDYMFVSISKYREKRINETLKYMCGYQLVGDFHSHTNDFDNLSKHDIKELKKLGEKWISLLVSIKKTNKIARWKYSRKERAISGSINKYFLKIFIYMFDKQKDKVVRADLRCDYIKTINMCTLDIKYLQRKIEKLERDVKKKTRIKKKLKRDV